MAGMPIGLHHTHKIVIDMSSLFSGGGSKKPKRVGQPSPPPILRSNIGVETARDDILRRQSLNRGQRNAVRAGETGGYKKRSTILQKLGGN